MTRPLVDRVADAVLYEGYLLYPYRPSSVKNRQRWTFGGLFPRDSGLVCAGAEPCSLQCECIVKGDPVAAVRVRVRFLHLIQRAVGGQLWQEAEDREVALPAMSLECLAGGVKHDFVFPARRTSDAVRDPDGAAVGEVVRKQAAVCGSVEVLATSVRSGIFRLRVRVSNTTALEDANGGREELLPSSLVSTHAILEGGPFLSHFDPPDEDRDLVAACKNIGVWPVLVGEPGEYHTVLASPIILYDYPQLAPESPGDLFDATEIDEILTLRILTMTDDEKREMRAADARADALLSRTESLAQEELMRLHGTIRGLRPVAGGGE
jgi:hypothetical protein